jgi:CRISPR-associated endonuclease/helicase Cas3
MEMSNRSSSGRFETAGLKPERFEDFYYQIWKRKPYAWQTRATAELAEGKLWPALSAPTGAGKTTLIECFLFALACTPPDGRRALPLRLFWVIDRRSVVDQILRHAQRVVAAIEQSKARTIGAAARTRLAQMAGDENEQAVQVRLWRGGLTGEMVGDDHAPLSPCTPAIICTTVDQIGSRMLFRGYGVSSGSRPIEAALTATDSLIVLDEAHLSAPFRETTDAIGRVQHAAREQPILPLHLLQISATLDDPPDGTFTLTEEELSEPDIARRFDAGKPIRLCGSKDQVRSCVTEAHKLAEDGAQIVAIVVNTVGTARFIHAALREHGDDATLLIGPVRPLDRQLLIENMFDRVTPRKRRARFDRPMFIVGTQTIEVGLDLDVDALVTACAPLSALTQRFGRLDRTGEMKGAGRGVIVEPPSECPVYGKTTRDTWEWLRSAATERPLDFGPAAIERLRDESSPPDPPAQPQAPILGPWHIELLIQTSERPHPDPDVAVFLHGKPRDADVQICWRADIYSSDERVKQRGQKEGKNSWQTYLDERRERMQARTPHPGELLSVSPGAARRWLRRQQPVDDLPDLESETKSQLPATDDRTRGRWALRVGAPGRDGIVDVQEIHAAELCPGDIIAVPTAYGGCDEFGWAPYQDEKEKRPVSDLGNLAFRRPRVLLPSTPHLAQALRVSDDLRDTTQETLERINAGELGERDAFDELLPFLTGWLADGGGFATDGALAKSAVELGAFIANTSSSTDARRRRVLPIGTLFDGKERSEGLLVVPPTAAAGRLSGRPVLYETHVEEVAKRARRFTRQLELSPELSATIDLAARNHDAGKLDPRFQAWLNDGAPLNGSAPLAKSGRDPREQRAREARDIARWPPGKRHESLSAQLLIAVERWPSDVIPGLLFHLVQSHHGDGRPFRVAADDSDAVEVTAPVVIEPFSRRSTERTIRSNSEIPWHEHVQRFIDLNERFGPWGLAALETILVLADRSVSAEEGR